MELTAVIPAYHAADHIAEAVASLYAQSSPPREIIVVDDGSTDETAAVAEAAGARVIRQSNGGPASARNTGIRAATTEWVVLL
ncbi:MAG: glycosyltransferase family 2 protein, partial [Gemmatimonadales bacterium]|nr:glycosyltransferase family 2 protein [Gemmatimonadales bacterium]